MASLLVIILAVELAVAVVNAIGATTINNLARSSPPAPRTEALWNLYTQTPMGTSKQIREQRALQASYLEVRRDLAGTSSQDEFAKWAKLRRQHDKMLEELEKMKSSIDTTRASFDKTVTGIRWLSTSGARWILPMWYAREPMFWLPHGWFPYYAEWLISFPRAPLGSVSVASWQLACTGVVALISDTLGAIVKLLLDAKVSKASKQREQPVTGSQPQAHADGEKESKKKL